MRKPRESQMYATITTLSPLRVLIDGAETPCRARALNGSYFTLTAGQRVTVTVRNPVPPLVLGDESEA